MAIQIDAQGSRAGVLKHIADYQLDDKAPEKSQLEPLKTFLAAEVDALPAEFNACKVVCIASAAPGLRNIQINVIPQKFHL